MDPLLRTLSDVRTLLSQVSNPYESKEVIRYLCKLGENMGFEPVQRLRRNGALLDCGWKDGTALFVGANVEYGGEREIIGALGQIIAARPDVGLLVTASNPLRPLDNILLAAENLVGPPVVIMDVRAVKTYTVRGMG